ncbi:MAG TPA: zinc-binding protein [Candidatus Hydrogenedentes bacterium]|nr:zinc-binding protein [Candidatus Hydrogenedentota bacterium]
MSSDNCCACSAAPRLIFACSGAADVGAVADQVARKLTRDGVGKMFCLAGIGGRVSGIVESTKAASAILAIDGCPINCARHCLEEAGFADLVHLQLADLGMEKGNTPIDEERIEAAARAGAAHLGGVCQAGDLTSTS